MMEFSLVVSGYTENEKLTGIYEAQLNSTTGDLTLSPTDITLKHPSYFDYSNQTLTVISEVLETQSPAIYQYQCSEQQTIKQAQFPLSGSAPCYVEYSPIHNIVTTAQYGSGHIDVFACDDEGIIQRKIQTIDNQALANSEELESHAHQAKLLPRSATLVTVDLGCDCLRFFPFDSSSQSFSEADSYSIALEDESGPRHVVFNQNETFGLILCEISEQLISLHKPEGKWQVLSAQPALPNTQNGQAAGAIKFSPDERFVYVTGRRQNLISCFLFSSETGECIHQYSIDCGGEFARDFAISNDGNWLVVANQLSNNLAVFRRNNESGELEDTKVRHKIPSPTCIKFI